MIMMVAGSWLEISISKQILSDFCFQEAAHESRAAVIGGGRAAVVTAGDDHDADGDADADDAADDEHDDNHDAQGNFGIAGQWSMVILLLMLRHGLWWSSPELMPIQKPESQTQSAREWWVPHHSVNKVMQKIGLKL